MARHRVPGVLLFCCFCSPALGSPIHAATGSATAATTAVAPPAQAPPEDPLGRNTPYGTVKGFLSAMGAGNYQRAIKYLEGTESDEEKTQLARQLKDVLDRGTALKLEDLSRDTKGNLGDRVSPDLEQVGTATYGDQSLAILLHLSAQKGAAPIWLFSAETLLRIQDIAHRLELSWGERIWPQSVREARFLSAPLFIWINSLLLVPLGLGVAWLLTRALRIVLRPVLRPWLKDQTESAMTGIARPMYLVIFALVVRIAGPLAATLRMRLIATSVGTALAVVAGTWLLIRMTQVLAGMKTRRLRQARMPGAIAATELYSWLFMCLWVIGGFFLIMRSLGLNLSTALAGLGVGGLAVAFAAQKTVENLFGTVTVISDKAIRVGDRCQAGNVDGWVESIGIRSTLIRALDRSLVSIPNGQLAMMNIGNLELRDKFLYRHEICLRCDTTAGQLRQVLEGIRKMMAAHPNVEQESLSVQFTRFGQSSLNLIVQAHVLVSIDRVFLEIQEEFLLRTMDIIEASGTRIALPSQITYLAKDASSDAHFEGAVGQSQQPIR